MTFHMPLNERHIVTSERLNDQTILSSALSEFDTYFNEAIKCIDASYMLLPTYGEKFVYRERIYCYELYHQFRSAMEAASHRHFTLSGEVDKRQHRELESLMSNSKLIPDLLYHTPGNMDGNLVVIEVKTIHGDSKGFKKDLVTLTGFTQEANYCKGILLVFGRHRRCHQKIKALCDKARQWHDEPATPINLERIELHWHQEANSQAQRISWENR